MPCTASAHAHLQTLCEGYLVGVISSYYDIDDVLIAIGITMAVTVLLTLFSFQVGRSAGALMVRTVVSSCSVQTKYDFTGCGPYLFVTLIAFCVFGFLCIGFQDRVRPLEARHLAQHLFAARRLFGCFIRRWGR
jgi:FtsH-binding integral membrane protein